MVAMGTDGDQESWLCAMRVVVIVCPGARWRLWVVRFSIVR
jgi:hypothetical protein